MDASLSAPRPAALDLLLKFVRVLVAGERRALFMGSAPPGTLVAPGLPLFFGPPDSFSSLFLSSAGGTTITVSFIPLATPLPEGRRWRHLTRDHRGQRFGGRCKMVGELCVIQWRRISGEIVSEGWSRIEESRGYARHVNVHGIDNWAKILPNEVATPHEPSRGCVTYLIWAQSPGGVELRKWEAWWLNL